MPDIRISHELVNKAEVYQIASVLDLDIDAAIGVLVRMWIWCDQHTDDGHSTHSPNLLEHIIGVPGLVKALEGVGWIELPGSGFRMPNLDRYTGDGRTTKSRRSRARDESRDKTRGPDGRYRPKNPATTSTLEDAGSSPGPDRTRTEPNRTVRELTSSDRFLAGRDDRVKAILALWKEALLMGSPVKARDAVWWALTDWPEDALLEASKAYLGSSVAQEKKYACRAHTFFSEERYKINPKEWDRHENTTGGWAALEAENDD